jgi:imidazolonepropionase
VTSLVVDNIGQLVTCDPELGEGPLGIRTNAAVACEDGLVVEVTDAGKASGDRAVDAGGRAVIPGFVDSHTHLVFAGDRAEEFAARMAGRPYDAGGIRVTTTATRGASEETLLRLARERRDRARRDGIVHQEIKSGYGLDVESEARLVRAAARLTDDATFLGAHVVPAEFAGRADDYVDLVCGEMLARCAPHVRWIDAFCEEGAFDADQCRAVLEAGRAAGLGLRLHGNQLRPGPGVRLAVELGAASVDHCTYLSDEDVEALADGDTVATFLPATDFATRQPYPDARRVLDAGARVALATNTNPGSSYTTSMSFVLALAVRDLHLTAEEALLAATAGGAAALRRDDLGRLAPGRRAHAVVLDAPSYAHIPYRPGESLACTTIVDGEVVWADPLSGVAR